MREHEYPQEAQYRPEYPTQPPSPGEWEDPGEAGVREGVEEGGRDGWAQRSGARPARTPDEGPWTDTGGAPRGSCPHSPADDSTAELEERLTQLARSRPRRGRRRVKVEAARRSQFTAKQRLLVLDTWLRSKLPAKDFGGLVGVSAQTLYAWKRRFLENGPAGLEDRPKGLVGSRLGEEVKRAILMLKEAHPDWGQDRISAVLARTEAYRVSPGAVGRFLDQSGFTVVEEVTRPHPDKVRRFERARPNQLWQTDLFTFVLKREHRRVHLVAYMDDHSRFVVAFGLSATASGRLVREVFEQGTVDYGAPEEVLTDQGTQYHTWRGKSAFRKYCESRGIKQIVARPRRPQTLGKIERFWGTLWRELLQGAIFRGIEDARRRIGLFIDHYNFLRPHQGIEDLVPADRYFAAAREVKETLKARIDGRSLELAKHGESRKPFYLTGRVGNTSLSLHAQGERVVMTREGKDPEVVDLAAPGRREDEREAPRAAVSQDASPPDPGAYAQGSDEGAPGTSPLDEGLERLVEEWEEEPGGEEPSPPSSPAGSAGENPAENQESSSSAAAPPEAEEGR